MKRIGYFLSLFVALALGCAGLTENVEGTATPVPPTLSAIPAQPTSQRAISTSEAVVLPTLAGSVLVDVYDPLRDPEEDVQQAIVFAQSQNKRIMLELGGDWCIWCRYLDKFYADHADILQYRADHFILVKINVSPENMNEGFLSQYPEAGGYPHIYLLDSDGTFLHSQNTVELEDGRISYVPKVFMAFLQQWAPPD